MAFELTVHADQAVARAVVARVLEESFDAVEWTDYTAVAEHGRAFNFWVLDVFSPHYVFQVTLDPAGQDRTAVVGLKLSSGWYAGFSGMAAVAMRLRRLRAQLEHAFAEAGVHVDAA